MYSSTINEPPSSKNFRSRGIVFDLAILDAQKSQTEEFRSNKISEKIAIS